MGELSAEEREAHDSVLSWCRGTGKAYTRGQPGMRETPIGLPDRARGKFCVIDLTRTDNGKTIEYARAHTWGECLEQLRSRGWL